jgi:SAM-dependent methyltransferase
MSGTGKGRRRSSGPRAPRMLGERTFRLQEQTVSCNLSGAESNRGDYLALQLADWFGPGPEAVARRAPWSEVAMRGSVKQFVKVCTGTLSLPEPIYEFGALQVPGQEGFADLRPLFPGKEYVGTDMFEGPGVDVTLNIHDIDLPAESVGTALVLDTLEHVEYARKAMEEIHRVVKPGGIAVISSVMDFPIHGYPYDYWRFTPEAFKSLLKPFEFSHCDAAGDTRFPHVVVGVGIKGQISEEMRNNFVTELQGWKKSWSKPGAVDYSGGGARKLVKQILPPILFPPFMAIYKRFRPFDHD